jgi:hypothetical protein
METLPGRPVGGQTQVSAKGTGTTRSQPCQDNFDVRHDAVWIKEGNNNMNTNINDISAELSACRKAWADNKGAKFAWCCHHEILIEPLLDPPENRITYILHDKPEGERAIRLHNFRPARAVLPKAYAEAWKAYVEAWKACVEAWKACAEVRKACDEAWKACAEVRKACDEELRYLFNQDWPDNTWNGKDIF